MRQATGTFSGHFTLTVGVGGTTASRSYVYANIPNTCAVDAARAGSQWLMFSQCPALECIFSNIMCFSVRPRAENLLQVVTITTDINRCASG
jgi:hypothetical protein